MSSMILSATFSPVSSAGPAASKHSCYLHIPLQHRSSKNATPVRTEEIRSIVTFRYPSRSAALWANSLLRNVPLALTAQFAADHECAPR